VLSDELTNCTVGAMSNNDCDDECDNAYCSYYKPGDQFEYPHVTWRKNDVNGNMTRFVGDGMRCPYNESDSLFQLQGYNRTACLESSSMSPFIDPNLGDDFRNCTGNSDKELSDIGDGECDDVCRTPECLFDGGDCELGCVGDVCGSILTSWNFLAPSNVYKMNKTDACTEIWPVVVVLFGETNRYKNCTQAMNEVDFNQDGYINFREYTALSYGYATPHSAGKDKAKQLNCSSCVGMEYYNI